MRKMIGAGLVAMLGGCASGVVPESGEVTSAVGAKRCPDPETDCTSPNGTGIYTAEDGSAGIDNYQLMVTHFVNRGQSVDFQGQYFDTPSGFWLPLPNPGTVMYADYLQSTGLQVVSVSETGTIPTWNLLDTSQQPAIPVTVTGGQLLDLKLHIGFDSPYTGKRASYVLDFSSASTDTSNRVPVRIFNMRWRRDGSSAQPTQYCNGFDDQHNPAPDQVVFQQGLWINPATAAVVRNANTAGVVTMSCRQGGPATVHSWGYPYRMGYVTYFFDAGLHMKRASYCGDFKHYTVAGTKILIADSHGTQDDTINVVEAWWTPQGATCIGPMRHPELGFNGKCNGQPLPACPTQSWMQQNGAPPYLGDGALSQQ